MTAKNLLHHTTGGSDKDQALRVFREFTATSIRLDHGQDNRARLDDAVRQCCHRSLPIYIGIPADQVEIPDTPATPLQITPSTSSIESDGLDEITSILTRKWIASNQPILIVGALARIFLSREALVALVDKLGCAVFCQPDAKSFLPESHPQFVGTFWATASPPSFCQTVMESDLWIAIGVRWSDLHIFGGLDIESKRQLTIEFHESSIRIPSGQLIQEISPNRVLEALTQSPIPPKDESLLAFQRNAHEQSRVNSRALGSTLTLRSIMDCIQDLLTGEDTLIADAGDSWFNAAEIFLPAKTDFHLQLVYASLGWGLPAALGSQLARPGGRTILMIGDGAFQMTAQELSTAIRYGANAMVFLFNNLGFQTEVSSSMP